MDTVGHIYFTWLISFSKKLTYKYTPSAWLFQNYKLICMNLSFCFSVESTGLSLLEMENICSGPSHLDSSCAAPLVALEGPDVM